jgi:hypothetical protein
MRREEKRREEGDTESKCITSCFVRTSVDTRYVLQTSAAVGMLFWLRVRVCVCVCVCVCRCVLITFVDSVCVLILALFSCSIEFIHALFEIGYYTSQPCQSVTIISDRHCRHAHIPGCRSCSLSGCRVNGSVSSLYRWRIMVARSTICPDGSSTGSRMGVYSNASRNSSGTSSALVSSSSHRLANSCTRSAKSRNCWIRSRERHSREARISATLTNISWL